jgi:hypothetical protein
LLETFKADIQSAPYFSDMTPSPHLNTQTHWRLPLKSQTPRKQQHYNFLYQNALLQKDLTTFLGQSLRK